MKIIDVINKVNNGTVKSEDIQFSEITLAGINNMIFSALELCINGDGYYMHGSKELSVRIAIIDGITDITFEHEVGESDIVFREVLFGSLWNYIIEKSNVDINLLKNIVETEVTDEIKNKNSLSELLSQLKG